MSATCTWTRGIELPNNFPLNLWFASQLVSVIMRSPCPVEQVVRLGRRLYAKRFEVFAAAHTQEFSPNVINDAYSKLWFAGRGMHKVPRPRSTVHRVMEAIHLYATC